MLKMQKADFRGNPRGLLRVEVQGTLARHFLLPELPAFLEKYPEIEFYMTEGTGSLTQFGKVLIAYCASAHCRIVT